jgi:hypothetical protein
VKEELNKDREKSPKKTKWKSNQENLNGLNKSIISNEIEAESLPKKKNPCSS